jgi:hypothetical protein
MRNLSIYTVTTVGVYRRRRMFAESILNPSGWRSIFEVRGPNVWHVIFQAQP